MGVSCFYKIGCRVFQKVMWCALWVLPWKQNKKVLSGENSLLELPKFLREQGLTSALLITDKGLWNLGLVQPLIEACDAEGLSVTVFNEVVPNPTIQNIEDGLKLYRDNNCQVLLAFGGGSPIDCAKGIAARVARPNKTIPQMRGILKVLKKIPPLVAIPTTSGTGSEATLATVVSNPVTHEKYAINDPMLLPRYIVLDPCLTSGLPQHITSTTGVDALTHAVEAYIGGANTSATKREAIEAVQLVDKYLLRAYEDGHDMEARLQMQRAAYLAGKAFTRAYVGYVHAVAHTLGGFYGVAHGLANSVILPYVLREYGTKAHKKLAQLADCIGLQGATPSDKANAFIDWIIANNAKMKIPDKIRTREGKPIIREEDIPQMVTNALHEANPLYPCPVVWGRDEVEHIYRLIQ